MAKIIDSKAKILTTKDTKDAFDLAQAELNKEDEMERALAVILDDISST